MPRTTANSKMVVFLPLLLGLLWVVSSACGDLNEIQEDITPRGIEEYHGQYKENGGYQNCLLCHPKVKLHLSSSNPYADLDLIREIVEREGLASCITCHYDDEE